MYDFSFAVILFSVRLALVAVTTARGVGEAAPALTYINLTLPATEDDRDWNHAPLVLKATDKSVIIAQRARAPGRDGYDIQVIEIEGDRWRYVGRNGRGITGVDGSILHETARSPDGRLWVLAEHSRFPNQIQGNQFCLFVLEDDNWSPVGPRFGARAAREHLWNHEEH